MNTQDVPVEGRTEGPACISVTLAGQLRVEAQVFISGIAEEVDDTVAEDTYCGDQGLL